MKKIILKKISVLSVISFALIVFCIKFLIFNYAKTDDIGYSGIGTLIFAGLGLFGILVDYIFSLLIKNRITLNIIELVIVCFLLILMW